MDVLLLSGVEPGWSPTLPVGLRAGKRTNYPNVRHQERSNYVVNFGGHGPGARARLLALLQAKADELLADPELPPPRRNGIMALREDFGGAPLLVAVVSRPGVEPIEKTENPLSAAAAVQNMSLAAWDAGTGSVWLSLGAAPPARAILGAPEGAVVVAVLAMGYPEEVPPPPPREPVADHLRQIDYPHFVARSA